MLRAPSACSSEASDVRLWVGCVPYARWIGDHPLIDQDGQLVYDPVKLVSGKLPTGLITL